MKKRWTDTAFIRSLTVILLLLVAVLLIGRGREAEPRPAQLTKLAEQQGNVSTELEPEIALLTLEETSLLSTVKETLSEMKIGWQEMPIGDFAVASMGDMETMLVCTADLSDMDAELLVSLISWVEQGGRLALLTVPNIDNLFRIFNRKLGIVDYGMGYYRYTSLRFGDDLLPLLDAQVFDEALEDYTLTVRLEPDCTVYMETADEAQIPLLWTRELAAGRVAVFNASLIQGKDTRGYVLNVLSVLEDVLVYPIINAGMVFIDDFPAPQPEGINERLKEQYGYDIQGFFRNHWWPDLENLTWKLGLRYTGVLIETYNDNVEAPFLPDSEERALIRYYTSELLNSGGEVGLHGYNHQPLCLESFQFAGESYTGWPDVDAMKLATAELLRYGKSYLPDGQFTTYVPPSNYLSAEGQAVLLDAVPTLSAISGLYLPESGVNALIQEFKEESDGTISIPRITSGYSSNPNNMLVMAQELALQGVFSHFIHPDDVLDDERGGKLGWAKLYEDFETMMEQVAASYPALRWSTAAEGAAAVQRYTRVQVQRRRTEGVLNLTLSPFYDEVWLALWCEEPPTAVENADLFKVDEGLYWLRATDAAVRLEWEVIE